jgi:hypothetical protein
MVRFGNDYWWCDVGAFKEVINENSKTYVVQIVYYDRLIDDNKSGFAILHQCNVIIR